MVNLHSPAIQFEPIHRILYHTDLETLLTEFGQYLKGQGMNLCVGDSLIFQSSDVKKSFCIAQKGERLDIDLLQDFLDEYVVKHKESAIDYIHGDAALDSLINEGDGCGIYLQAFDKSELFPAIKAGGVLPRKTFSMGEAWEKRYYMECRKIR